MFVLLWGAGVLPPTPQAGGEEAASAGGDDGALQHDPYDLDDMGNLCDMLPPTPAAADGDEAATAAAAAGEGATQVRVAGAMRRLVCGSTLQLVVQLGACGRFCTWAQVKTPHSHLQTVLVSIPGSPDLVTSPGWSCNDHLAEVL